jgi:tetratricopeptide (TPR) repeat protein
MAFVYLCEGDGPFEKKIAVKRLKEEYAASEEVSRLFLRECYIWMRLPKHPNVVQAYTAHMAPPEPPMVVLECLESSLRDRLRGTGLAIKFVVNAMDDICAGMLFLRTKVPGFVHRDIKPENILLTNDGRAKVTDFGLATIGKWRVSGDENSTVGTPMYMAPEQIDGRGVSVATDVYGFGCVAFEMLTGEPVFGTDKGKYEYLRCHSHEVARDVRDIRAEIPAGIAEIVRICLNKKPADRYLDFEEVKRVLRANCGSGLQPLRNDPIEELVPERLAASCQGLINLGFLDDAMTTANELVGLEPKGPLGLYARVQQARIYGDQGSYEQSEAVLAEAERHIGPEVDRAFLGMYHSEAARTAHGLGHLNDALVHTEKAAALMPQASVAWHNLADAYLEIGRLDEAIKFELRAIEISPDLRYFLKLARINAIQKNDLGAALKVIESAMSVHSHLYQPYVEYLLLAVEYIALMTQSPATTQLNELNRTIRAAKKSARRARELGAPEDVLEVADAAITRIATMLGGVRPTAESRAVNAEAAVRILRRSLELTEWSGHEEREI